MSITIETVKLPKVTQPQTRFDKKAMQLAASWYIAMQSKELGKKPKAIELFGQYLVAWRDQTGRPAIMARYCSHMGASLAIGEIVDDCIRCPYHHWRYDDSGDCVSIPEVDHIPPTARQVTYPTTERYGYIWVWYGSKTPLFPLPEFSPAEGHKYNYMPLRSAYQINTTVRRLVEAGTCDYFHTTALHEQKISGSIQFTLLDKKNSAQQTEPPGEKGYLEVFIELPVKKYLVGPVAQALGLNAQAFTFHMNVWPSGYTIKACADDEEIYKAFICTTPIAENKTIGHYLMTLKKTGKFWRDIPFYLLFGWQSRVVSAQDLSVWNTLKSDGGGAYVKHDRGVVKYRKFYQRWVDKVE